MDEVRQEHLDPTSEISLETVKERAVRGIVVLTGRTFFLQILGAIALAFLATYLGPFEWGVFAIVNAVINFLNYFSDVGLAAALIQKKEHPTDVDLKTTFFVQESLVLLVIGIMVALAQFFTHKYSLNQDGVVLYYAVAFSFFLSSLKSIPSVLLERKLEFVKLTFPQILEQVIYYVVLVIFAVKGFGIKSFTIAVITRDVVGVVAIYIMQPWRPGIAFSRKTLSGLFKFGIPYQINTFLAALKDDGMTLVLGGIIGPIGVGYLAFAQKFARFPLAFFMDTVTRVTFPAFSRMQDKKEHLERSVTRSIFFICLLVFPSLIALVILAPVIIQVFPQYGKWGPAMLTLTLVSVNFGFAAATTQLTNLLNAIGKIRITFYLMIMWTILTWTLLPFLSIKYGFNGAALGYALVGSSSVVAILVAKRYVNFSVYDAIVKPLIGASLMGVVIFVLKGVLQPSLYSIGLISFVGLVTYTVLMVAIIGVSLIEDAKKSFKTIFNK
ncbi:MAG TPA: oligosaccharide flippase family protein [Candidatus Saccharimonadales bacterium]|nr:oligosaccharide flippase family protein [Candidatus Saccharimonadales bacterium]